MPLVEFGKEVTPLIDASLKADYPIEVNRFRHLCEELKHSPSNPQKKGLSKREYEIAAMAVHGMRNKEIAVQLSISENTVKYVMKKVFEKLDIDSRVQLSTLIS